jgi:hypothetical protein
MVNVWRPLLGSSLGPVFCQRMVAVWVLMQVKITDANYGCDQRDVLLAVAQEVAVQLLDVILGDGDVSPGMEDHFRGLGIAGDFLLVASVELFDFQIGK